MVIKKSFLVLLTSAIFLFAGQSLSAQSMCKLALEGQVLTGSCENRLFTGLKIQLNEEVTELDEKTLFKLFPTPGTITIGGQSEFNVNFEITKRAGYRQILFKPTDLPRVGWYTLDNLKVNAQSIEFDIDNDPTVPAGKKDLKIIREARKLLSSAENWNQEDDRRCEDDIQNDKYSFFCALQTASTKVEGAYNHRNAVMQMMRHLIQARFPERRWEHRFKDFNNMESTTFEKIHEIIDEAEATIKKELKEKK